MNAPARIAPCLNVRGQFPGIENWHYLDSAATAQKPQAVIDVIAQAYGRGLRNGAPRAFTSDRRT